jgi:hypothetical protein
MDLEGILSEFRRKRNDDGPGNEEESLKSGDVDAGLSESSSIVTIEDDGVMSWEESSTGSKSTIACRNPCGFAMQWGTTCGRVKSYICPVSAFPILHDVLNSALTCLFYSLVESIHSGTSIFLMEKENEPQGLQQSRKQSNDTLEGLLGSPSCSSRFQISPRTSAVIFESATHHLGSVFRPSENTVSGCLEASPSIHSMRTPRNISTANSFSNNPVPKVHHDMRSLEGSPHTFSGRPPTPRSSAVILEASEHHVGTSFRQRGHRVSRLQCPEAIDKRNFGTDSPSGSHRQSKSDNSPSVRAMHSRSSGHDA